MAEDSRKERLEAVVAAYGTDVRRWPPADRALAPAGSEIIEIAGAREAAALDRLLGSSVVDDEATTADADLMDRILAGATQGGAVSTAAANDDLTSLGGHATGSKSTALQSRWSSRTSYRAPAAAALMAASLALGIFVGSLQSTQSTVARIGTLAGLDMAVAVPSTAFEDDFLAQDEEDIL